MSNPEAGPPPPSDQETGPLIDIKGLEEARAALGQERAHERTGLRDQRGILTEAANPEGNTAAEKDYIAAVLRDSGEQARAILAESGRDAMLQFMAERILDEQLVRQQAEIEARDNPDTKLGKLKAGFVKHWREHPRVRLAIGIGLVAATGGFGAAGLTGVAIGAAGVRAGMSAVGGYMGAKAGQELAGARYNRRGDRSWFNPKSEGDLAQVDSERAEAMSSEERWERMAALLSTAAEKGRNQDQAGTDKESRNALYDAELAQVQQDLQANAEHYRGANLVLGAKRILDEKLSGQMTAEHERLRDDKKVNRRRTFVAAAVGAAAGASSLISGLHHTGLGAGHGHHGSGAGGGSEHGGHHPGAHEHDGHHHAGDGPDHGDPGHSAAEAQGTPEVAREVIKPGDNVWTHVNQHIAHEYNRLHGHGAWGQLGERAQNAKIAHSIDIMKENPSQYVPSGNLNLVRPGEYLKVSRKIIEAGANYRLGG